MNKPVAWINTRTEDDRPFLDWEEAKNELYQAIPLYTHPVKELTDEEIKIVLDSVKFEEMVTADDLFYMFARAILRKAQEQ